MILQNCKTKILFLLFAFAISNADAQTTMPDTAVMATIEGEPVIFREFMQQASQNRSQVIRYFRITYGLEYSNDFWHKTIDGKSPSIVLKEKTLDTLVKIKVQQIAAKTLGIMTDISYAGFLLKLEKENIKRLEAKSRNEVIYGPVQYTEDVYFNYLFTNMVNQVKNKLEQNVFKINESQLKAIYERDKDIYYRNGHYTDIKLVKAEVKNGLSIRAMDSVRYCAINSMNEIRNCILKNSDCFLKEAEKFRGNKTVSFSVVELTFNDTIHSEEEDNALLALIREKAKKLNPGDCSKVAETPGTTFFFQVIEKKSLGYRNFENSKKTIRSVYVDQLYEEYISTLLAKTNVDLKKKNFEMITF